MAMDIPIDPSSDEAMHVNRILQAQNNQPVESPVDPQEAEQIMLRAKQASVQEATDTSKQLAQSVLPAAGQAGLAVMTAGMSMPAQMGISAGSELVRQQIQQGLHVPGVQDVAEAGVAGLTPWGVQKGIKIGKGIVRGIANVTGRGKQAGTQAIADTLGVPTRFGERVANKPAKAAYAAAESGPVVDTRSQFQAVNQALQKEQALGSQANKDVVEHLQGLSDDFAAYNASKGQMDTSVLVAKAQRLSKQASDAYKTGNTSLGDSLTKIVNQIKTSGLKDADQIYTRQNAVEDIFRTVNKSGKTLEGVDNLLMNPKTGDRIRGALSDKEIAGVRTIASRMREISGSSSEGVTKGIYDALVKAFAADPNGVTVMRHAFGPDMRKLTYQSLVGFSTFMRGYLAHKEREYESSNKH